MTPAQATTRWPRLPVWKASLLSLPMLLITVVMWLSSLLSQGNPLLSIAGIAIYATFSACFLLMLVTGRTYRYRSLMFIMVAVAIPLEFIPYMVETYGSMLLNEEMILSGGASFCPLTMPMIIIPALVKRVVIFPGELLLSSSHGAFSMMFILWIGSSLAIGRGWCSWGCFYGGWDELFSRLRRRPRIRHEQIDSRFRVLPFAVLLSIVLLSAMTFTPIYCEYLCPFKLVTEFQAPSTLLAATQVTTFVTLFFGLVVALPILTRRRTQCGLFCPFGAMQSLFNKINIFGLRIDTGACRHCLQCVRSCPTFSLDESSVESGKPLMTCTKCGQCVDACPTGAISYHIKGTGLKASRHAARLMFLYPAYILLFFMGGGIVGGALLRLLRLVTTGSMLSTGLH